MLLLSFPAVGSAEAQAVWDWYARFWWPRQRNRWPADWRLGLFFESHSHDATNLGPLGDLNVASPAD